jgi:two-component system sensor histidine kinase RpfC
MKNRRLRERRIPQARSLAEVAAQLRNASVDAVLAAYQERNIAVNRVLGMAGATAWALLWYALGPGKPRTPTGWNYPQALAVLPWLVPMLIVSIAWWQALARGWIKQSRVGDAIGAIGNLVGCFIMLKLAWDMMIAFVCFLPISCVSIGARYSRSAFYWSIAASVVIVQFASPPNYWPMRPHFMLFAIVLVIFLPLSVMRLLNTIRTVSEEAIKSRNAQSKFISTMSHELRTPLNSVVNNTELIDTEPLTENQRRIVASLASSAIALRNRVNEVLDVRAIDAGKLAIVNEPLTFAGILRVVEGVVGPLATTKGIKLHISGDGVEKRVLRSDAGRIEQIFTNLATNAVKFTPTGGSVRVRVEQVGQDDHGPVEVRCTVTDTGIGIPDDKKPHIFEPFYQISSGTTRTHEGSGLGLHIAQSVTALLGGSLTVADNPSGGSIFTWRAALAPAAPGERPTQIFDLKQAVAEHRRRVRSLHCLMIDDKASNLEVADQLMRLVGHTMVGVSSGAAGIEVASCERFDVVFTDLHMPTISGFEVLEKLRQSGLAIKTPVVIVSADTSPEAIQRASELGAFGYLVKPIAMGKLLSILEEIAADPGDKTKNLLMVSADDEPLSGLDVMRAAGDPEATLAFVETCLRGIEASTQDIYVAVRRGDAKAALAAAHALKNEYLNLGVTEGVKACAEFRDAYPLGTSDVILNNLASMNEVLTRKLRQENAPPSVTQYPQARA